MESNDVSLTSTLVGSVSTPNISPRFDTLLRGAGLSPPEQLVQLTRPDDFEFEALVTEDDREYARTLLIGIQSNDPNYRPPDRRKRNLLRIPSRKGLKFDAEKLSFTKHEVGKAFNALFDFNPLPEIGVAQGLLSFVQDLYSLDELWDHFQDSKLQKRQSSIFRRSVSTPFRIASWLETATEQGNTQYIRLMCQLGATQLLLDHAFVVALTRHKFDSARILASFGASIGSVNRDIAQMFVKNGNVNVVRLLLAVPNGLSTEDWQYCFQKEITGGSQGMNVTRALLQCVHYDSSIASAKLLLKALEAKNTAAVAVLLAYQATCKTDNAYFLSPAGDQDEHDSMAMQACLCVSEMADAETRYTLYSLLNQVGLLRAGEALESEMTLSLAERRLPMINLLISAGVWPPIQGAVATMNFHLLEIMAHKRISPEEASRLVSFVPESIPEDDMVRFLNIFSGTSHSLQGPLLDQRLVRAVEKKHPRTVRALLQAGADANHKEGSSYLAACTSLNYPMLAILCKGCPLNAASLRRLLAVLLNAANFEAEALERVLKSAVAMSATTINKACIPKLLKGCRHIASAIPRLLHHGLDINLANGKIMQMVVQEHNIPLLEEALTSSTLTTSSLKTAFKATHEIKSRHDQLKMMSLLLRKAHPAEIGQSDRLYEETMEALSSGGDQTGLKLLLLHRASVDANGGKALGIAAATPVRSTTVLETLLSHSPSGSVISSSCRAALASPKLDQSQTEAVLKLLLASKTSLTDAEMTALLHSSIKRLSNSVFLPSILIKRHAKIGFQDLQAALASSSEELFELLARNFSPDRDKSSFFAHVRKAPIKSDRRLWVYYTMLRNWTIPKDCVSEALAGALKDASFADIALPKLLLQHGADVKFMDLLPLRLSFRLEDPSEISKLLVKYIKDGSTAAAAFRFACASSALEPASRLLIYRCLLKYNIEKELLSQALTGTLKDGQDIKTIRLLLAHGANPAEDGAKCFILAYRANNTTAFKAMCPCADVDIITRALLEHLSEERHVRTWLGLCMDTLAPPAARIKDPKLLYEAMRKFPDGDALVEKILQYGVSAGALVKWALCKDWVVEEVTPLLWALLQEKKVSNRTLLALIARGDEAQPLYMTDKSQVSAAFACMLDPSRTPILDTLLQRHMEPIRGYIIPALSFSYLGQKPIRPDPAEMVKEDLCASSAALYLGNLPAYWALGGGTNVDDGSLHAAALLALPDFVRRLLRHHNANHPLEKYGMLIPLAVACESYVRPWCKVGNANGTFEDRKRETMSLLAQRTNLSWSHRRRTVLHWAIHSGPDAVEAMLEAVQVAKDPQRNDRYLYTDRDGIVYSLSMYVSRLLNEKDKRSETGQMIRMLRHIGKLEDRMYRPQGPGKRVEQPAGYCGMPRERAVE